MQLNRPTLTEPSEAAVGCSLDELSGLHSGNFKRGTSIWQHLQATPARAEKADWPPSLFIIAMVW